jgi:NAD(P)-dependent dehydrogenase (short-subunit alcohol dehydrogenase family)
MDFKPGGSVVSSAGPWSPSEALPVDEFQKVLDVNLLGTVIGIKHAAKAMIPAKQGLIISTASIAGSIAGIGPLAYSISKSGVIAASYSASAQLTKHGIRVNCISPGAVATPLALSQLREIYPDLSEEQFEKIFELENSSNIAGARLTPEVIAKAALFLASDDSPYISGHNLVVDGGYLTNKIFSVSSYLSF